MATMNYDAIEESSPLVTEAVPAVPAKSNRAVKAVAALVLSGAAVVAGTKAYYNQAAPVEALKLDEAPEALRINYGDDDDATIGTFQREALRAVLTKVGARDKIVFGHENSNREGQYFWDDAGVDMHSDIFNTTGQYPGMYGFSFQDIIDGSDLTSHVLNAARQNSIIEFFWEANNPVNDGSARDDTGYPCAALLPGNSANAVWNSWMDTIIDAVGKMKIGDTHVPMILRLFHENTESWYWWGDTKCDATNYKAMWNYTRWYLTDHGGLQNILFIYAPAKVSETTWNAYTGWYPGDDQVDIIGFDRYGIQARYPEYAQADCEVACDFAAQVGKPCALAETGIDDGITSVTNADWYMSDLLDNLLDYNSPTSSCQNLSYVLTWSNEQPGRYWVPLPGQTTEEGFIQFVEDDRTIMAGDKSFADITKSVNYGFKSPGDFADAHGRSETGPVPIGGTKPANGLNGVKPFEEGYSWKDWGSFEWTEDRLSKLPDEERAKVEMTLTNERR